MISYSLAELQVFLSRVNVRFSFTVSLCTLRYLSSSHSQPPGVIFPISFSPSLPSLLHHSLSHPSPSLLWWSFYRISLRSSPLSLMCSINDVSLKHTHTHTLKGGRNKMGKRRGVIEIRGQTEKLKIQKELLFGKLH